MGEMRACICESLCPMELCGIGLMSGGGGGSPLALSIGDLLAMYHTFMLACGGWLVLGSPFTSASTAVASLCLACFRGDRRKPGP